MATRQGGSSSDPTGNAHVGVTDPGVSQSTPIRPNAGPKLLICTAPMEVGLKLLRLPSVAVIQPGHMKPKDGWLFLCE